MFLKSLELYGFKSFADRTRLEFADGTTSLLGPNGCGKSNIVDAIKWVLGEQSTKTLRAQKMEDIIFNGTEKRKAMNYAEVALVISNEKGVLPTSHSEVEIKRRLFRSGESEFFINRELARLRDIRELFFDTGVGKSAYSILEQGKIDQILSHKPEDRRYIFEEAAGITRYKLKSLEASRKLERTEENIEQVETLLAEIKRQYESRKTQVNRLERYKKLEEQLSVIEVDVQLATVKSLNLLIKQKEQQLDNAKEELQNNKEAISDLNSQLENQQSTLSEQVEQRINYQNRIETLKEQIIGKEEQVELLLERYHELLEQKADSESRRVQLSGRLDQQSKELDEKKESYIELNRTIEIVKGGIEKWENLIEQTLNKLSEYDKTISESEKEIEQQENLQQQLATDLQKIADKLANELDSSLKESGYSTTKRQEAEAKVLEAINNLKVDSKDLNKQLNKIEELFTQYTKIFPSFLDQFIAPEGIISQKHAIDQQLVINRNKIVSLRSLIGKTRELVAKANGELEEYRENLTQSKIDLGDQVAKVDLAKILIENLTEQTEDLRNQLAEVKFLFNQTEERIGTILEQINLLRDEKDNLIASQADYSERLDSLVVKISDDHQMLQTKRESVNALYEKQNQLRSNVDKLTFHLESLAEQIKSIYHNYFENYGKSLKEYDDRLNEELEDVPQLREELSQIKKQIQSLGYINHMAQEEFREIKERHDFLVQQMSDLEKAKDDLTEVIDEIRKRSEELFIDSFVKIREAFQDIFHRMFGGGRADLRLLDNDNILESGIDILAQPPGKKLDRLAPLSGGEKSLTAVALLFATYKVKPSPFCVLDEIDASLDDRNIGYFLSVLEEFSESSQFIIITHNKHTVMGSQTLLGVTMQEKGVSKAISYRMGYDSDKQVIYEDPIDISLTNTV